MASEKSPFALLKGAVELLMEKSSYAEAAERVIEALRRKRISGSDIPRAVDLLVSVKALETNGGAVAPTPIDTIEALVEQWVEEGGTRLDAALKLVQAPFPEAMQIPLMEFQMRVLYTKSDYGFNPIMQKLIERSNEMVNYPDTARIIGSCFLQTEYFDLALKTFNKGLLKARETKNAKKVNMLQSLIAETNLLKKKKKAAEAFVQRLAQQEEERKKSKQAKSTGKHNTSKEAVEYTIQSTGKGKKVVEVTTQSTGKEMKTVEDKIQSKGKEKEVVGDTTQSTGKGKKAVGDTTQSTGKGKKAAGDTTQSTGKGRKAVGDTKAGAQDTSNENIAEFEVPFHIILELQSGPNCFIGVTRSNITNVKKSFVDVQVLNVDKIQDLVALSSAHENLLTVEQVVKQDNGKTLFVTECVHSVEYYFLNKFKGCPRETREEWWKDIHADFWLIFRDIIRGLMYLFVNDRACGNVSFNAFVTLEGKGRVLPCLGATNKGEDFRQLSLLMKNIIKFPHEGNDLTFLHEGLTQFFDHIDRANEWLKCIPAGFLVDHPYFYNMDEKINFSFKLRKLVKESTVIKSALARELSHSAIYDKWHLKLDGLYKNIFQYPGKKCGYKTGVDIIRFFGAVYTHANEREYKKIRGNKRLKDQEIERDLLYYYPHYYTDMFRCLCAGVVGSEGLQAKELMKVSSIYHRAIVPLKEMVKESRPETS